MKHALIIGGTGMLSGVSLWLIKNGYHASIIARNPERRQRLLEETELNNNITPILVDYKDHEGLQERVNATIRENGELELVVAWIHSDAPKALKVVTDQISDNRKEWQLFHVLGSNSNLKALKREVKLPGSCVY